MSMGQLGGEVGQWIARCPREWNVSGVGLLGLRLLLVRRVLRFLVLLDLLTTWLGTGNAEAGIRLGPGKENGG